MEDKFEFSEAALEKLWKVIFPTEALRAAAVRRVLARKILELEKEVEWLRSEGKKIPPMCGYFYGDICHISTEYTNECPAMCPSLADKEVKIHGK